MPLSMGRRSRKNPTIELGASHQAGSWQIVSSKLEDILSRPLRCITY